MIYENSPFTRTHPINDMPRPFSLKISFGGQSSEREVSGKSIKVGSVEILSRVGMTLAVADLLVLWNSMGTGMYLGLDIAIKEILPRKDYDA